MLLLVTSIACTGGKVEPPSVDSERIDTGVWPPRHLEVEVVRGADDGGPLWASRLTVVGDRAFFVGYTEARGREIWVTDGTRDGTHPATDLGVGAESGRFGPISRIGERAFFHADHGPVVTGWFASDGTPGEQTKAGEGWAYHSAFPYRDGVIYCCEPSATPAEGELQFFDGERRRRLPSPDGDGYFPPVDGYAVGPGGVYFFGRASIGLGAYPATLFRTDASGDADSTEVIATGLSVPEDPVIAWVGDALYFVAAQEDPDRGLELWRSDGTPGGTRRFEDIAAGPASAFHALRRPELAVLGSSLLFVADDGVSGPQIWRSDGDDEPVVRVTALDTVGDPPRDLTVLGDRLYFVASDGVSGFEVWSTDGTAEGTQLLADLVPGALPGSGIAGPHELFVFDDRLYFVAQVTNAADVAVPTLVVSRGTAETTNPLVELVETYPDGLPIGAHPWPREVVRIGRTILIASGPDEASWYGDGAWTSELYRVEL